MHVLCVSVDGCEPSNMQPSNVGQDPCDPVPVKCVAVARTQTLTMQLETVCGNKVASRCAAGDAAATGSHIGCRLGHDAKRRSWCVSIEISWVLWKYARVCWKCARSLLSRKHPPGNGCHRDHWSCDSFRVCENARRVRRGLARSDAMLMHELA